MRQCQGTSRIRRFLINHWFRTHVRYDCGVCITARSDGESFSPRNITEVLNEYSLSNFNKALNWCRGLQPPYRRTMMNSLAKCSRSERFNILRWWATDCHRFFWGRDFRYGEDVIVKVSWYFNRRESDDGCTYRRDALKPWQTEEHRTPCACPRFILLIQSRQHRHNVNVMLASLSRRIKESMNICIVQLLTAFIQKIRVATDWRSIETR